MWTLKCSHRRRGGVSVERYTKTNAFTLMSLTVRMRSSSGGSLSTGEVWDRYTGRPRPGQAGG